MINRVGLVGPYPPPAGGIANQTEQLVGLLRDAGVTVEKISVNAPYKPAFMGRVRYLRALFRLLPYLSHLWRCAGELPLFHVMANSGWSWFLFAMPAILIARLRGIPVVLNYRGGGADRFLARSAWLVRPVARLCTVVLVPSDFLTRIFRKYGVEARVLPNIVDRERFPVRNEKEMVSHLLSGSISIAVTRNLYPIYDIETAVRAFEHVQRNFPNVRLRIAGSGSSKDSIESLVGRLGLGDWVTLEGALSPEGIAALYSDSDIFLNTSRVDNAPNAILEALSSGLPVVSTDAGGIPDLVEHDKHVLLCPVGDDVALGEALCSLLKAPDRALALRTEGLAHIGNYEWGVVGPQLLQVYADAITGRSDQAPADSAGGAGFEAGWRRRFESFGARHDDDAGIAGWSTAGLASRLRQFAVCWQVREPDGRDWLDAGCGAGTYSRWLTQQNKSVVAVDYALSTLRKARERSPEVNRWIAADVRRLPFRAGSFNGVLSFGVTQALARPDQLVSELGRVVQPGGQVWIDGLNRTFPLHGLSRLVRRVRGKPAHLEYITAGQLKTLMKASGFVGLELHWLPLAPESMGWFQHLLESRLMRGLFRHVPGLGVLCSHSLLIIGTRGEDL